MGAEDLRTLLDGDGIDARAWGAVAYSLGISPSDIAAICGVTRRTVNDWKNRYKWNKRNLSTLSANCITRRLLAITMLGEFVAPVTREFGKSAPIGNRNRETHGLYTAEGARRKLILQESRLLIRKMKDEAKRMMTRLPMFDM